MNDPLDLTFAIQIQCIVYLYTDHYEPGVNKCEGVLWDKETSSQLSHEDKIRIIGRQNVVHFLKQTGLPTHDVIDRVDDNQKWTVAPTASIQRGQGLDAYGFLECDVELSSPTFRFCPKALRRVEQVVRFLTRNLNVNVNESCAFYVRIGTLHHHQKKKEKLMSTGGFTMQTLKHFCMLTALFEHQFNTLHPPHRINNPTAKPPSAIFHHQNPWDAVATIQNCKSLLDLVLLYATSDRRPDECLAYNLVPLIWPSHHHHHDDNPTIEFRQHKGTLDSREMSSWIQLVAGLLDAIHNIPNGSVEGMAHLISSCAFDRRFTVFDLFKRLGLSEMLEAFYKGGLYMHLRPEPVWVPVVDDGGDGDDGEGKRQGEGGGGCWWEEVEERQMVEMGREMRRLEAMERRHERERRWVADIRSGEVQGR